MLYLYQPRLGNIFVQYIVCAYVYKCEFNLSLDELMCDEADRWDVLLYRMLVMDVSYVSYNDGYN